MNLVFLGGADEVGASCTLIEIDGLRILIDAGIRVVAKTYRDIRDDQLPDLHLLNEYGTPDYIFITHVHTDHTGALPLVVEQFPHVPVFATAPTIGMLRVLQADSQRLMTQRQEQEGELPLYDEIAISRVLEAIHIVDFHHSIALNNRVKATLFPAGHILGAASILLESDEESVLMSGDISLTTQRAVVNFDVPIHQPDVLVMESTYGGKLHPNRVAEEKRLVASIATVIERGGRVLIPAFALGRAQEVLQILLAHQDLISAPIYVDGMVRAVCEQFDAFSAYLPLATIEAAGKASLFFRDNVKAVQGARHREAIIRSAEPAVVVSSSGMLSGGPSVQYAKHWVSDSRNAIFLTGYQDEESPGQHLYRLTKQRHDEHAFANVMIELDGQQRLLCCTVETYSISAHADEAQIVSLVEAINPAQVALVHGDHAARQSVATKLRERNHHVHLPVSGQAWLVVPAKARVVPSVATSAPDVHLATEPLEQNEARRIGLESFPPNARLRKISFDSKRKRMLLTFDFPDRVRILYAEQIALLGEVTGWRVEISPVAIQQALETAVYDLLPDAVKLVKAPSVYAQRREVEIVIHDAIDKEHLAAAFFDLTGYRLDVRTSAADTVGMITFAPSLDHAPMEINSAYRLIREALEPHGLQKVGLRNGQLTLTFISPEVGLRQSTLITQLADATGYDMALHPHPDQRAILQIVNRELRHVGWLVRKGPGLHTENHEIVVHLYADPAETDQGRVVAAIEAQTGYHLHIKSDEVAHEA